MQTTVRNRANSTPIGLDRCVSAERLANRTHIIEACFWALIALGLVLRVLSYCADRPLWHDETMLALNLLDRSYVGLLEPLAYRQAAPPAFLLAQKFLIQTLGSGDWVFRLFPFLCSIGSLFCFSYLARRLLVPAAALIAVALFALLPSLVYYSAEAKQYAGDVLCQVGLLCLTLPPLFARENQLTVLRLGAVGVFGAVAIWLSHPALFALAGAGLCLTVHSLRQRDVRQLTLLVLPFLLWMASFVVLYVVSLRHVAQEEYLQGYWARRFMPLPPHNVNDLAWFGRTFFEAFSYPGGFALTAPGAEISLAAIGGLAFLLGCVALQSGRREILFGLLAPIPIALLASGLHRYPFGERLILFLVPPVLLIVAVGAEQIWTGTRRTFPALGSLFLALLFLGPIGTSVYKAASPVEQAEVQSALAHIREHWQPGDGIYVYVRSRMAYSFYARKHGFTEGDSAVYPGGVWSEFVDGLSGFRGRERVWVVLTVLPDPERCLMSHVDPRGRRLETFTAPGVLVGLYDFRTQPAWK